MTVLYAYKIGVGHNLPDGSLTNIEDVQPTGDDPFPAPRQFGNYTDGEVVTMPNGADFVRGDPKDAWMYDYVTRLQDKEFRTLFCAGGYDADVTYTTMTDTYGTYTRHNARVKVPRHPEIDYDSGRFIGYKIEFIKIGAAL